MENVNVIITVQGGVADYIIDSPPLVLVNTFLVDLDNLSESSTEEIQETINDLKPLNYLEGVPELIASLEEMIERNKEFGGE